MMSAKFTPAANTRMRTAPLDGSGSGASRSSRTSGPPVLVMKTWRMSLSEQIQLKNKSLKSRFLQDAACSQNRNQATASIGCGSWTPAHSPEKSSAVYRVNKRLIFISEACPVDAGRHDPLPQGVVGRPVQERR